MPETRLLKVISLVCLACGHVFTKEQARSVGNSPRCPQCNHDKFGEAVGYTKEDGSPHIAGPVVES
jgi:predicted Zn-ribbon and HTH transcriptional regulator